MKKLIWLFLLFPLFSFGQVPMEKGSQLGIRVGGGINYGSGFDLSYIKPIGSIHRIDITMPFRFDGKSTSWQVNGYYEIQGSLNDEVTLFVGPGVGFGATWHKDNLSDNYGFILNLGAVAGITYSTPKLPFDIDFSMRPTFVTVNNYDGVFNLDFTVGFLYRF
ncbi:hypothetical protein K4L44_16110 [Halosquirtibacter laminarini]|uniref:Uncharacterized protein n=1 Tax=Halosquirtibacter laminarini TaxID=3374600 RepID=A0AC61NET0_9BACT|nr:hypothetical protein K4L44_16110 [Prolixibacteraceae bacterium]